MDPCARGRNPYTVRARGRNTNSVRARGRSANAVRARGRSTNAVRARVALVKRRAICLYGRSQPPPLFGHNRLGHPPRGSRHAG